MGELVHSPCLPQEMESICWLLLQDGAFRNWPLGRTRPFGIRRWLPLAVCIFFFGFCFWGCTGNCHGIKQAGLVNKRNGASSDLPLLELDMFGRRNSGPQCDRRIVTSRLIKDNSDRDKVNIRSTLACSSENEVPLYESV